MLINLNKESYLRNVLQRLEAKGFDISEESNLKEILSTLSEVDNENIEIKNKIINSLNFENRTGKELEEFFEFFGIYKFKNYNTVNKSAEIINSGNRTITIKGSSRFLVNDKTYMSVLDQTFEQNTRKEFHFIKYIIYKKIETDHIDIGGFKILISDIKIDGIEGSQEKLKYINNNIAIINFKEFSLEESDNDFINRAKAILQSYGDGNMKKIKNYILGIEGVADVVIEEKIDNLILKIIPENIKLIDDVIDKAQEAIIYFSSNHIQIEKPSITEIEVDGLTTQLVKWFGKDKNINIRKVLLDIKRVIKSYVKEVYFEDKKTISRDTIEFLINRYFSESNMQFSLDESNLNIFYKVYSSEDYNSPLIASEIKRRGNKEIVSDIAIIGEVK